MVIRFSVQADTEAECAAGFRLLCDRLGAHPLRGPADTLNSWLARATLDRLPAADEDPAAGPQK